MNYVIDLETLDRELSGETSALNFVTRARRTGSEVQRGKLGAIRNRIEALNLLGAGVYAEVFPDFWVEVTE